MKIDIYRPHPKDDGRLCFHKNVSVNTPVRGNPIRLMGDGSTPILPDGGIPPSFLIGVPQLANWGGTLHRDWMRVPPVRTGWGHPPLQLDGGTPYPCWDYMGVPHPCWDWMGVPPTPISWMGYPPHSQLDRGTPPTPPSSEDKAAE